MRASDGFDARLQVLRLANAEFFARDLFYDSFRTAFPAPPADSRARATWFQYVAFYRWSELHYEPVGFCNWIRHGEVYLEGGLCVRRSFYRRLPRDHWLACKRRGGVAQIMMEVAAGELADAAAWFGHCGDPKAQVVVSRVGYVATRHPHVIVKWFRDVGPRRRERLIEEIAALGPF